MTRPPAGSPASGRCPQRRRRSSERSACAARCPPGGAGRRWRNPETSPYSSWSYKQIVMFLAGSHRDLTTYFNALANPTRLRILERLGQVGEESVNDLALDLRVSQ